MEMNDAIIVVQWPEVQKYQEHPEFFENAELLNSEEDLEEYGYSAYTINKAWLKEAFPG